MATASIRGNKDTIIAYAPNMTLSKIVTTMLSCKGIAGC